MILFNFAQGVQESCTCPDISYLIESIRKGIPNNTLMSDLSILCGYLFIICDKNIIFIIKM